MDFDLKKYDPMPIVPCNRRTHRAKFWFFSLVLPVLLLILSFSGAYALFPDGMLRNIIGGGCSLFVFYFFIDYADKMDKKHEQECSYLDAYLIELHSDISFYESRLECLSPDFSPSEYRRVSLHLSSLKRILSEVRSHIPSGSDWSNV